MLWYFKNDLWTCKLAYCQASSISTLPLGDPSYFQRHLKQNQSTPFSFWFPSPSFPLFSTFSPNFWFCKALSYVKLRNGCCSCPRSQEWSAQKRLSTRWRTQFQFGFWGGPDDYSSVLDLQKQHQWLFFLYFSIRGNSLNFQLVQVLSYAMHVFFKPLNCANFTVNVKQEMPSEDYPSSLLRSSKRPRPSVLETDTVRVFDFLLFFLPNMKISLEGIDFFWDYAAGVIPFFYFVNFPVCRYKS